MLLSISIYPSLPLQSTCIPHRSLPVFCEAQCGESGPPNDRPNPTSLPSARYFPELQLLSANRNYAGYIYIITKNCQNLDHRCQSDGCCLAVAVSHPSPYWIGPDWIIPHYLPFRGIKPSPLPVKISIYFKPSGGPTRAGRTCIGDVKLTFAISHDLLRAHICVHRPRLVRCSVFEPGALAERGRGSDTGRLKLNDTTDGTHTFRHQTTPTT
jgi:hypothetical protein